MGFVKCLALRGPRRSHFLRGFLLRPPELFLDGDALQILDVHHAVAELGVAEAAQPLASQCADAGRVLGVVAEAVQEVGPEPPKDAEAAGMVARIRLPSHSATLTVTALPTA